MIEGHYKRLAFCYVRSYGLCGSILSFYNSDNDCWIIMNFRGCMVAKGKQLSLSLIKEEGMEIGIGAGSVYPDLSTIDWKKIRGLV